MGRNFAKTLELFFLGIAVLLVVSACGGGGGATTTTPAAMPGDKLFTAPTNAVNVTITPDVALAASQVVTATGATLIATDANGNQFTLVIPASAVIQATTITMTVFSNPEMSLNEGW